MSGVDVTNTGIQNPFLTSFHEHLCCLYLVVHVPSPLFPYTKSFNPDDVLLVFSVSHKFLVSQAQFKCHQYHSPALIPPTRT